MLTAERLKDLFDYDPDTGIFTRLVTASNARAGSKSGCRQNHGYLSISVDGRLYLSHRLAWLYMTGSFPEGQVDHTNGVRTDNRWENLAAATDSTNRRNMGIGRRNKSGVVGVRFDDRLDKWVAYISVNYRYIRLGVYEVFDDAVDARKRAEREHGFHEKHGLRPAHQGGAS